MQIGTTIQEVTASRPNLIVFRIAGEVSREDMAALSERMNHVFDTQDKVDLMLIFDHYDGAETGASFGWESIKSRLRSLTSLRRYVVVGAPDGIEEMIELTGSLLPVDVETFEEEEIAWQALGARAAAEPMD